MSVTYKGIHWNRQKRLYDLTLFLLFVLSATGFVAATWITNTFVTAETLIIRVTSVSAFLLLHIILCIGPLCRLDRRFLPLLYNRRHLGVTMFLLAAIHAVFAIIQFHALGKANPIVSVFTAYRMDYLPYARPGGVISDFPFEPFGALALVILFFMAATSHDFWLRNLGASVWKLIHMMVYVAYGSLLVHVAYGALQSERNPVLLALVVFGFAAVFGLHLAAYRKEAATDRKKAHAERDGYARACAVDELAEGRGKTVVVRGNRIAVFLHNGRVFALSNACRHQGGPIGEGRIIDGCVTCPWHGWQYNPEDGCSPPPFAEVIPTFDVRIIDGSVYVSPVENGLRSACAGAEVKA
ncbi:MAG: ferric reductase-like transmembrane domain-containing protein [Candidatus Hydrogenedentes bacterium]|nr:ferric reductase-like transmembrane domain-containing protein [Candidatus Hydrogenedentota bacterium]